MNTRKLPPYLMLNTEGGEAGGGAAAAAAPANDNSTSSQEPAAGKEGQETPEQVIARLTSERDQAKREADAARVSAKAKVAEDAKKDQLLALAKAIGIEVGTGEKETVESLTQKLTEANGKTAETEAEKLKIAQGRAIDRAAWANQVPIEKAAYLEFLLSSNADFAKLDAGSDDYQTKVTTLVKGIVDSDPIFKATPGGTTKSGAENFGGAGGTETVTQEVFDKMTIQEQTKLYQTNPDLFRRLSGAA